MRKILQKIIDVFLACIYRYEYHHYYKRTRAYIQRHFNQTKQHQALSKQQKAEIKDFYKRLTGKNVSFLYHEYFMSRTGVYNKEYMPIDLYEADIIGRANRLDMRNAYCDKNMLENFLHHIRLPHSFLKNINGYFYFEGEPLSKEQAVDKCANIGDCIIKPSLLSKGRGVKKMRIINGVDSISGESFEHILEDYKKNYIIQEVVHQHTKMNDLNPTSINTLRIMTYRSDMEILVVYVAVRIGRKGQIIDNQSAGGISAKVNENGSIAKYAFGSAGDDFITMTDSGITLEGYEIPFYSKVIEAVKRSHYDLPFFDIVGWDIAVGENGDPILIEWNAKVGPSQTACGTGLGKYTERIINEVWSRPNTRSFISKYGYR